MSRSEQKVESKCPHAHPPSLGWLGVCGCPPMPPLAASLPPGPVPAAGLHMKPLFSLPAPFGANRTANVRASARFSKKARASFQRVRHPDDRPEAARDGFRPAPRRPPELAQRAAQPAHARQAPLVPRRRLCHERRRRRRDVRGGAADGERAPARAECGRQAEADGQAALVDARAGEHTCAGACRRHRCATRAALPTTRPARCTHRRHTSIRPVPQPVPHEQKSRRSHVNQLPPGVAAYWDCAQINHSAK